MFICGKPKLTIQELHLSVDYAEAHDLWTDDTDRSDDLLYPTRWQNLLALPASHSPDIIQVISWNDYGESNNIAPVAGAQPGSEAWTHDMSHEAFREMTYYFIGQWRDRQPAVGGALRLWMWYRTHPADMIAPGDKVGRPEHADWVISFSSLLNLYSRC